MLIHKTILISKPELLLGTISESIVLPHLVVVMCMACGAIKGHTDNQGPVAMVVSEGDAAIGAMLSSRLLLGAIPGFMSLCKNPSAPSANSR